MVSDREANLARQCEETATELGVTMAEYLGMLHQDRDLARAEIAYQFKAGEPFLKSKEDINNLPTKMRRLHQWYMKASKAGCEYIILQIKEEHYVRGDA